LLDAKDVGKMVSVYRCTKCGTEFKGNNINYCAFCGRRVKHVGIVGGGSGLQDYLKKGWKLIMFRKHAGC